MSSSEKQYSDADVSQAIKLLRQDIDEMKEESAYVEKSSKLEQNLNYWIQGVKGEIPDFLIKYAQQAQIELDPEYKLFLKLQRKFDRNE